MAIKEFSRAVAGTVSLETLGVLAAVRKYMALEYIQPSKENKNKAY